MDEKKWYQSKSIWGAILTVLAMIAGLFGYSIGTEDQATLADILVTFGGFVGAILAIYGRVKASKKVT